MRRGGHLAITDLNVAELPWLDTGVEVNEVMLLPTLWIILLGGLVVFLGIVLLP